MDEGDSSDTPKIGFGGGGQADQQQPESGDLFEQALEDALCVFKAGGANTDLLKENEGQILFYVDLDNEEIIDKERFEEEHKNGEGSDDGEQEISEKPHPMLFNQYPLCRAHSLFLLWAEQSFPQVLSDELIELLLQIFKVAQTPTLRLGYNSMGADCIINNLHFHVLTTDSLFGEGVELFPIE